MPITADLPASRASSAARRFINIDAMSREMPTTPTNCAMICMPLMRVW